MNLRYFQGRPAQPGRLFVALLLIIFAIELAVMQALPLLLTSQDTLAEYLLDSTLLAFGSAPFLWVLIVNPLRRSLRRESRQGAAILGALAEGVVGCDRQGRIFLANAAAETMFGYSPGQMNGKSLDRLLATESGREELPDLAGLAAGGGIREFSGRRKTGERFPAELSVSSLQDDGVKSYFTVLRDISAHKEAQARLTRSRDHWLTILEGFPALVWRSGLDGLCDYFNRNWLEFTGRSRSQELGNGWATGVHPEDLERCLDIYRNAFAARRSFEMEYRLRRHDGVFRWVLDIGRPYLDVDGEFAGFIGSCFDITERRDAEQACRQSEERLNLALKSSGMGIWGCRFGQEDALWSDNVAPLIGLMPEAMPSAFHLFLDRLHPEDRPQMLKAIEGARNGKGDYAVDFRTLPADGTLRHLVSRGRVYQDEAGVPSHMAGVIWDETPRKLVEAQLQEHRKRLDYLAHHDHLTHLPNRLKFLKHLQSAVQTAKKRDGWIALLLLNLDRFKNLNESLGHESGDRILVKIAKRLNETLAEGDCLAHLGGDEFVLVREGGGDFDQVTALAQRLQAAVARMLPLGEHRLYLNASVGVSFFPEDGADVEALLKSAETAMRRAKAGGGGGHVFHNPEMSDRSRDLLLLEHQLRQALEREELRIHYQPQFDLATNEIVGMEALIRWMHPQRGMVSPADFIPVAETSGLIVPIGDWVLRTACRQAVRWLADSAPPLRLAVNISARQFRQTDLAETVAKILAETGLPAENLELELTESVIMEDVEAAIFVMKQFKSMGIKLAIDDFGTGYSSLGYLKRFPISHLKIDRSFVRDILHDDNDAQIAASVIALAHNMKLKVVAEGIEEEEQATFLRARGCDYAQGFLYGRPVPEDEFRNFLTPVHLRRRHACR